MVSELSSFPQEDPHPFLLRGVRGKLVQNFSLGKHTWFRVGGRAETLFKPADLEDLIFFLKNYRQGRSLEILGVGSNLLIRDGGIKGITIRLTSPAFTQIQVSPPYIYVGAGALDRTVAEECCRHGLSGFEFLVGIPGTMGGALKMNAGAYGSDLKSILVQAEVIDHQGDPRVLSAEECGLEYRYSRLPKDWIVTRLICQGKESQFEVINQKMQHFLLLKEQSQPTRGRTGGSTFKNPPDQKAWALIDQAGCRGLVKGGAQVSELHCNFLINTGTATAQDIEDLGEEVRHRVLEKTGIDLEWEIKRIGEK